MGWAQRRAQSPVAAMVMALAIAGSLADTARGQAFDEPLILLEGRTIGDWQAQAYASALTGGFALCTIALRLVSGQAVQFERVADPAGLAIIVDVPELVFPEGMAVPVAMGFDGRSKSRIGTGVAVSETAVRTDFPPSSIFVQNLRERRTFDVNIGALSLAVPLEGSGDALAWLDACPQRHARSADRLARAPRILPRIQGPDEPPFEDVPEAPFGTADDGMADDGMADDGMADDRGDTVPSRSQGDAVAEAPPSVELSDPPMATLEDAGPDDLPEDAAGVASAPPAALLSDADALPAAVRREALERALEEVGLRATLSDLDETATRFAAGDLSGRLEAVLPTLADDPPALRGFVVGDVATRCEGAIAIAPPVEADRPDAPRPIEITCRTGAQEAKTVARLLGEGSQALLAVLVGPSEPVDGTAPPFFDAIAAALADHRDVGAEQAR